MFRNHLYYEIKPLLPFSIRMPARRWFARRTRSQVGCTWPILRGSEQIPPNWSGWPHGKQFAVVLTHDIEGPEGLAKCRALMQVEKELGFRSSFNFIPEGPYEVPRELREELTAEGFEVGVHDLHHNGKLFRDRNDFRKFASKINHYLNDWNAAGFRAGFMLHNLQWFEDLEIEYDASTFDTDPFEPQPDGVGTIFPFWIPKTGNGAEDSSVDAFSRKHGYVELPYTLPQDSTLFLLFGEQSPTIWHSKTDWIAEHGGMVLLDTHPDYMAMDSSPTSRWQYPVDHYRAFLSRLKEKYSNAYWHALPRDVARQVKTAQTSSCAHPLPYHVKIQSSHKPKLWIDLDNTPHVPFFEPIIDELRSRGYPLMITARDAFQVCELAIKKNMPHIKVGRHYGKNRLMKATGLAYRALQLAPIVLNEKPALGISHGARSQLILSNWLRLPTVLLEDYEHAHFPVMMRPEWVMAPTVIPDDCLATLPDRIRKYPGIKEDVYAWKLKPDSEIISALGINASNIVVTVRPPATEAHYHNPESERLFVAFMKRATSTRNVRVVLLPRNQRQGQTIKTAWPDWFADGKTIIPNSALDGMNLIWHSDLVVSGGGTMNREAAALGVPVYSIFRGTIGAVDRHLKSEGRLVLIESVGDVETKILLQSRNRRSVAESTSRNTLDTIVDCIEEIADHVSGRPVKVPSKITELASR